MTKLSPREQFEKIPRGLYSDLLYRTLEALVKAVEPEKHTCGECGLFCGHSGCRDKVTGRAAFAIHLIYPDLPACEDFVVPKEVHVVEPEDTPSLDERTIVKLAHELSETQAEIEKLRPFAENWQLVLGMGDRTRLVRGHPSHAFCQKQMYYWVERQSRTASGTPLCDWRKVDRDYDYLKNDPAEVLRSIQGADNGL